MAEMDPLDKYLPKRITAEKLNKSERTLDRWADQRTGPPRTLIGQTVYYHIDDLRAWIKAQREDRPQRRRARHELGPATKTLGQPGVPIAEKGRIHDQEEETYGRHLSQQR